MYQKTYNILGMSCGRCQKKISDTLVVLPHISAEIHLKEAKAEITSDKEIDLRN